MDILQKIIDNDGSCTGWAKPDICKRCPLSKLRQKDDGSYLSCVEALEAEEMSEQEADAHYKKVAEQVLVNKTVHEIIFEGEE